jgi:hypothetical protein
MTTAATRLQLAKAFTTNGWRRFEPSAISFGAGSIWASDGFGFVAEIDPGTARLERMVFTSSEAPSSTTAAGLTWVADELDGVGTFAAGSDHVAVHHISWAGQPVDVGTVAYGAGLIWALGEETNFSISLTDPPTVGVVTTLDPHTGRITHQWRISPDYTAMVIGNGGAYVSDDNAGRLLRLTPPHGLQILHGPAAAQLRHPSRALGDQPKRTAAAHRPHTALKARLLLGVDRCRVRGAARRPGVLELAGQFEPAVESLGWPREDGDSTVDRFTRFELEYDPFHVVRAHRADGDSGRCSPHR